MNQKPIELYKYFARDILERISHRFDEIDAKLDKMQKDLDEFKENQGVMSGN